MPRAAQPALHESTFHVGLAPSVDSYVGNVAQRTAWHALALDKRLELAMGSNSEAGCAKATTRRRFAIGGAASPRMF